MLNLWNFVNSDVHLQSLLKEFELTILNKSIFFLHKRYCVRLFCFCLNAKYKLWQNFQKFKKYIWFIPTPIWTLSNFSKLQFVKWILNRNRLIEEMWNIAEEKYKWHLFSETEYTFQSQEIREKAKKNEN